MEVKIKRYTDGRVRKKEVKLDRYDSWSIPWTISQIMVPLLKQLKDTKHGHGAVNKEDVPEELHSTYCEYGFSEEAYDWLLDELIWMFTEVRDDCANEPHMYKKVGEMELSEPDERGGCTMISSGMEIIPEMKILNHAYHKRIENAWRLFGAYAITLWD